jgi:hypothetical protein
MVRRAYTQRSLIEVLLPDSDKLWDPILRQIDALLDDDDLVDRIAEALARRHLQSRRRGRLGTPAAVVLRMLVLKHLHDWSFDAYEREVRRNLVPSRLLPDRWRAGPGRQNADPVGPPVGRGRAQGRAGPVGGPWGVNAASSGAGGYASTRPWWKPPFTTPLMPRSWRTGSGYSRARCGGSGSGSESARSVARRVFDAKRY